MTNRYKCTQCRHICAEGEVLIAQNPFDLTDMVNGCPQCKSVDSLVLACDVEGCDKEATNGWPSSAGYRHTCYVHNDGAHHEK